MSGRTARCFAAAVLVFLRAPTGVAPTDPTGRRLLEHLTVPQGERKESGHAMAEHTRRRRPRHHGEVGLLALTPFVFSSTAEGDTGSGISTVEVVHGVGRERAEAYGTAAL